MGATAEWMWGDGAAWKKISPLEWSDTKSIEATVTDLRKHERVQPNRPVLLKIPAGVGTSSIYYENIRSAIGQLEKARRDFSKWSVAQTFCMSTETREAEDELRERNVPLLDKAIYTGVLCAVDKLNVDDSLCSGGICAVYSCQHRKYFILYQKLMELEAERFLKLKTPLMLKIEMFLRSIGASHYFQLDAYTKFDNRKLIVSEKDSYEQRYDVLHVIGRGIGGIVNLLKRKGTGQEYAMKRVEEVQSQREISALCNLRHPNCIKILEKILKVESDGTATVYIICEYARRGDLSLYIKQEKQEGRRPTDLAMANIFKQVMHGLSYMHGKKLVHNDIKGQNILVFEQGGLRVTLTDYGCARYIDDLNPGVVFGDPRYASPENLEALMVVLKHDVVSWCPNFESDVWSFGVTLYSESSGNFVPFLYELCPSGQVTEEFPFKLREAQMSATKLQTALCREQLSEVGLSFLASILQMEPGRRPTMRDLLNHPWVKTTASNSHSNIKLSVHPDASCRIILNLVAWRLPSSQVTEYCELFQLFDTEHKGVINQAQFQNMFPGKVDRAAKIFDLADIDGDLTLEFNEFVAIAFNWMFMDPVELENYLREVIRDWSEDGSDTVGIDDLSRHFGSCVHKDELQSLALRMRNASGRFSARAMRIFLQSRQEWIEISQR